MQHSKNTYNYIGKKHGTRITVTLEEKVLLKKEKPVDDQTKITS